MNYTVQISCAIMHHMVQNTSPDAMKPPGRPPAFDVDQVIAGAIDLFWRQGYDDTSLADLERHLGINRSTLYNSFDGKAGLFESAVAAYFANFDRVLLRPLFEGEAGLADLVGFTDRLRAMLFDAEAPSGCLVVNSIVSGDAPGAAERYYTMLRGGFDAALQRAGDLGEVDGDQRSARSAAMLVAVLGVSVASKSGMPAVGLDELIDGLRSVIWGWAQGDAPD